MKVDSTPFARLPPEQEAIRAKCFHSSGQFVAFPHADVETSIPQRFEKIVRLCPDRVAIKTKDRALTFYDLNLTANRVAQTITEICEEKHEPVAVLLRSAIEVIPALLGVLKAGRFFIALDPSFPLYRLRSVLEDSGAGVIVSDRHNLGLAEALRQDSRQVVLVDQLPDWVSTTDPGLACAPDALSHVIYTSGSTGGPKGVMQTHANLLHEIMAYTNSFHICAEDRLSLLASCSTGQGIKNAFCALLNGASLHPFDARSGGASALASHLLQEKITVYHSSTGLFRSLTTLTNTKYFPEIRLIRLASQQAVRDDVDLYKKHFSSNCILVNVLSTTETGSFRCYFMSQESMVREKTVPVGYALVDKMVALLDDDGREVGPDEVGEIVIKSPYLSPGYWQRNCLAEGHPVIKSGEERIHFSGDLGRMASDGCLFHLGRKDFQVKVRGYRVETAEVERTLLKHPAIRQTAVVGQNTRYADTRIVAYFVSRHESAPTTTDLRDFVKSRLPDYMVPSKFVALRALPLTPNGKLDHSALPDPGRSRPALRTTYVAPRTKLEEELAQIWEEVLDVCPIGINDNFFDLGGHSLAITRIVSRLMDKFRLAVPLLAFFDSPTVQKMAAEISRQQSSDHKPQGLGSEQFSHTKRARSVEPEDNLTHFPKEDLERSIPERFEKIVRMLPDQIAVKTSSGVVTYSELNALANHLASAIIARRGTKAEVIPVFLDKGAQLMAAMLAVLKTGKFFTLLDDCFPGARNGALLEDCQAGLVIADRAHAFQLRHIVPHPLSVLEIDSVDLSIATSDLNLPILPEALATIVYTSGSTGEPKGLLLNHRDLLHRIMLRSVENRVCEHDRIALLPTGTANAVTNSFFALLNGATLCPFDTQKEGAARLVEWLSEQGITICAFSSSLFRSFAAALTGVEKFPALRAVRLRSETVHKSDIDLYKKFFPDHCRLVTGLSTSETGQVTSYVLNRSSEIPVDGVPIGYPVQDKEILILDDAGNEVGFNQVGEIVVRSRYLAAGYWRSPELTKKKFKTDPNDHSKRLCFTGDLGVRLPGGCLVHKGRKDFRCKIRGYGVDLGEVEKRLLEHSGVKEAVVLARETDSGDTRLIAYYTARSRVPLRVDELRSFLEEKLPHYMIPLAFVPLEVLPLTPNGKIDRRALPDPGNVRPELDTSYLSPRNAIEEALVAIWEDVLAVRPIGVSDGFFDLGGDSLSATRVISQIIKHFHWDMPLQSLFEAPTITEMASVIAQRQGQLSGNDNQHHAAGPPLDALAQEGLRPLSYSQRRLWILDQLEPRSFTYNLFSAYQLKGELNVTALEQSFNEIIRRHEVLRTVVKSVDGSPEQVVLPTLAITIPVVDLRKFVSEKDKWTTVRRMFKEEAQQPFDLTTGPLLRTTLLQLADDDYLLLRAMHHIVTDGWSEGVLFRELAALYEAFSNGQRSPLADLSVQYADYAVWQRQWFQGKILESQLAYWKKQLENIPTLEFPTDRPRPAVQSSRGTRQYFTLSDTLSSELKILSRRHGVTDFMALLAAFQTLLSRYTGQTDIAIGSPVAGRSRREFEGLIGFFLNTLVLRLDLSGNPSFTETMRRVRDMCLAALSHQELPFEKLVEELHPERNLNQNPLFQVTFAFQNTPRFLPRLSNIIVDPFEVETGIARFDLHLFMEEKDGHLEGYCDYDTNLFNADTIERMVCHFQTMVNGILENPDRRISELPILTDAERHQLLIEWNNTKTDYPKNKCIHQLFEEQVKRSPEAVAVIFEEQQLTYKELNRRANQLAHYLQRLGVGPESLVAICLDRSIDMIVALLGILKAGGAYVPLDPSYPKERLACMLEDIKAGVLLTESEWAERFGRRGSRIEDGDSEICALLSQVKVICVDGGWAEVAKESGENPISAATAENLAYVIYTSGTTGTPKGVEVPHRGVVRLLFGVDYVELDSTQTFLHLAPISFDAATFEIWGALLHGGRCVLFPGKVPGAKELGKVLRTNRITTLWLTASLFNTVVEEEPQALSEVKQLLIGGEALSVPHVRKGLASLPETEIINGYGPTESTTFTCCYAIPHQLDDNLTSIPIGRPIGNTEIYILDQHLAPVPIGVAGELYIGGDGLARGYLKQPKKTKEKFIANPFSNDPSSRLYRTGDLARYLPDGNLEFLGRIDNQVKIRGYRIELGEIEAVLNQHKMVRQSVVMVWEESPGRKRLVAYVVASDRQLQIASLRDFLKKKLPDYMVPSAFVFVDALPLTPNGKVDRKALPAPDTTRPELEQTFVAPRNPIEKTIAEIWREVLKLEKVGMQDNFFDLGGHSLLATQAMSRVREALQVDLPLRVLFEAPTVAMLALRIKQRASTRDERDELLSNLAEVELLSEEEAARELVEEN